MMLSISRKAVSLDLDKCCLANRKFCTSLPTIRQRSQSSQYISISSTRIPIPLLIGSSSPSLSLKNGLSLLMSHASAVCLLFFSYLLWLTSAPPSPQGWHTNLSSAFGRLPSNG